MKLRTLAIAVISWAAINGAQAGSDKNRVLFDARWYTEAYVKEHIKDRYPALYRSAFHPSVSYVYAADAPGFKASGANLLSEPMPAREGGFIRLPLKQPGTTLAAELDQQCVRYIAQGLKALTQGARQKAVRQMVKGVVIAGIQSGELAAAPLDLDRTRGREISLIAPPAEGRLRCNIYKTHRGGYETYDISVVLRATAAYAVGN